MDTAEFEEFRDDVRQGAKTRGLLIFETFLPEDRHTAPAVRWRDDDWRAFLDVAAGVDAKLLYLEDIKLDDDAVAHYRRGVAVEVETDDDGADDQVVTQVSDEHEVLLDDAKAHLGETHILTVAFPFGTMVHMFVGVASWTVALQEAAELIGDDEDDGHPSYHEELNAAYTAAVREADGWVDQLAAETVFIAASNESDRIRVASIVVPQSGEWLLEDHLRNYHAQVARQVINEAFNKVRSEVAPQRHNDLRDNINEHGARLATMPGWAQAKVKKEREPLARRYVLETLGIKAPGLIDALMRAALAATPTSGSFEF